MASDFSLIVHLVRSSDHSNSREAEDYLVTGVFDSDLAGK